MAYKRGPSRQGIAKAKKLSREERFKRIEEMRQNTNQRMRDKLKPKEMLTGGQSKIAAKAPPTNKIDAKDFAVLRAEKAKGRGKGLQDEKMKPGKVMKADKGKIIRKDPTKAINRVGVKDRYGMPIKPKTSQLGKDLAREAAKAAKATRIGKIAAGVAGAALLGKAALEKMYEKRTGKKPFTKRPDKKMGGGMMMKRPMMARVGMMVGRDTVKKLKEARKKRKADVVKGMGGYMGGGLTEATQRLKAQGKMGGGMMMRPNPIGMKSGKSVKVKCKLGRNKPTKMY